MVRRCWPLHGLATKGMGVAEKGKPSRARLLTAVSVGHSRRLEKRSAMTRLISSGMIGLCERSQASISAAGTCSLAVASAPASVELVSP